MQKHQLYAKLEKCLFEQSEVEYTGLIISAEGLRMDPSKVSAGLNWPTPWNIKDIQSFLGFANFYCCFIADYSRIVKPLTNLTRKDVLFDWSLSA
ncbi:MAG: hypothetical protein ACREHG_08900, partial [Candidatus Saccharimonadales bacterium]